MNVTLTNQGSVAVPFSSTQDKGFATMLEPGAPYGFTSEAVTVASVGDNPSAAEEFVEGIHQLLKKLGELVAFWRERNEDKDGDAAGTIQVLIYNQGANALRVLLGSNTNEVQVGPGGTYEAVATEYIELREMGV